MGDRLVACGSRTWNNQAVVDEILDGLDVDCLAHGACRGADLQAQDWAKRRHVPYVPFHADWYPQGRFDRHAGRRRNRMMLTQFRPTVVVAFKEDFDHLLRRGGTEDMVKIARAAQVPVEVVDQHYLAQLKLF